MFCQDSKLSDVLKRHPDFLDQLALCLDRNMRLIPNWKQLARELNVDEDVIKKLEQYKDQSPTIRLFEYLEVTQPQLTIQQLRNAMLDIRRNDLFSLLTTKGNIGTRFLHTLWSSEVDISLLKGSFAVCFWGVQFSFTENFPHCHLLGTKQ